MGLFQCFVRFYGGSSAVAICSGNHVSFIRCMVASVSSETGFMRCLLPKLALIILIGSQVANLSDGHTRGKMSTAAKLLDVFSIILSSGVAAGTGWWVSPHINVFS